MPLTSLRWRLSLLVTVACVTALALTARDPDQPFVTDPTGRSYYNRKSAVTRAMQREADALVHERLARVTDSLDHPLGTAAPHTSATPPDAPPGDDVSVIAIDATGRALRDAVDTMIRRELSTLPARRLPIRVVVLESPRTTLPRVVSRVGIDAPIARYVQLPVRDGAPCTLLLTVRAADTSSLGVALAASDGVLGPCAFVAAFGPPGSPMRAHLDSAAWHPAAFWRAADDGDEPRRFPWSDLTRDGVRCLARGDEACARAWARTDLFDVEGDGDEAMRARLDSRNIIGALPWYGVHGHSFGVRQRVRLSDLSHDLGPERFEELWRSEAPVDVSFQRIVGMREGTWTSRWLSRSYASFVPSPWPIVQEMTWWLLVVVVSVALLWQRRERRST